MIMIIRESNVLEKAQETLLGQAITGGFIADDIVADGNINFTNREEYIVYFGVYVIRRGQTGKNTLNQ